MIFLLVILTFVAGIAISAYQETRGKRVLESQGTLHVAPIPVLARVPSAPARPYEPETGNLWVG